MGNYIVKPNSISSPTSADFAIAAAQLCFLNNGDRDPVPISRLISRVAGRPILVVNLEHLPQRPGVADNGYKFTELSNAQIKDHAERLQAIERKVFPDQGSGFPKNWKWHLSGEIFTVSSDSCRTSESRVESLPSRMYGDYWTKAALLTTADRTTGNPSVASQFSQENLMDAYRLGHELAHAFQLCPARLFPNPAWQWETEIDADKGSFAGLKLLANRKEFSAHKAEFEETIKTVIHERALYGFSSTFPIYFTALRLNGDDNVTYEEAVASNRELRFRVYAGIEGINLPFSSKQIQALITHWEKNEKGDEPTVAAIQKAFGDPWKWGAATSELGSWSKYNFDFDRSIPMLNTILQRGDITDPLSKRNAELIIDAALYLHPDLQQKLVTKPAVVQKKSQLVPALA